jgi:tetratricopeptide (TPR) repeat protein
MPTIDPEKMIAEALQKAKDCFTVGELEYGEEILTQVLRCEPDNQAATQLMGVFLHRVKRYEEAAEFFLNAIDLNPDNPDNYNNLALCVTSLGRTDDAIKYLKDAIFMDPNEAKYYNNLGLQYRQKRMYKEAIDSLLSAKKLDPKNPQIMSNIGGIMGETHELEKAKRAFKRALEFDPEFASAHVDLAYTLQLMGNRKDAWSHYEYRFKVFENLWFYNNKYDPLKRWKTTYEDLNNKTLILYCEQGLGDAIQFVRYIPIIKERHHCKVYLHCSDVLKSLFAAQNLGIDDFMTESIISIMPDQMPTHDLHASIMSLPYLLGNPSVQGSKYMQFVGRAAPSTLTTPSDLATSDCSGVLPNSRT